MTFSDLEDSQDCPLCCNELDITDRAVQFCGCGYQVCLWCYHQILEEAAKASLPARCPNCRSDYNQEKITMQHIDAEKLEEEKRKMREKDKKPGAEAAPKSRANLHNIRVVQPNLVYAVGLPLELCNEDVLRDHDYFGQFGKLFKISVNRSNQYASALAKHGPTGSAYVTFRRPEDALRCIRALEGHCWKGKPIKACFGTTKYCNAFLKGLTCNNPDCLYLHELADEADCLTKEEVAAGLLPARFMTGGGSSSFKPRLHMHPIPNDKAPAAAAAAPAGPPGSTAGAAAGAAGGGVSRSGSFAGGQPRTAAVTIAPRIVLNDGGGSGVWESPTPGTLATAGSSAPKSASWAAISASGLAAASAAAGPPPPPTDDQEWPELGGAAAAAAAGPSGAASPEREDSSESLPRGNSLAVPPGGSTMAEQLARAHSNPPDRAGSLGGAAKQTTKKLLPLASPAKLKPLAKASRSSAQQQQQQQQQQPAAESGAPAAPAAERRKAAAVGSPPKSPPSQKARPAEKPQPPQPAPAVPLEQAASSTSHHALANGVVAGVQPAEGPAAGTAACNKENWEGGRAAEPEPLHKLAVPAEQPAGGDAAATKPRPRAPPPGFAAPAAAAAVAANGSAQERPKKITPPPGFGGPVSNGPTPSASQHTSIDSASQLGMEAAEAARRGAAPAAPLAAAEAQGQEGLPSLGAPIAASGSLLNSVGSSSSSLAERLPSAGDLLSMAGPPEVAAHLAPPAASIPASGTGRNRSRFSFAQTDRAAERGQEAANGPLPPAAAPAPAALPLPPQQPAYNPLHMLQQPPQQPQHVQQVAPAAQQDAGAFFKSLFPGVNINVSSAPAPVPRAPPPGFGPPAPALAGYGSGGYRSADGAGALYGNGPVSAPPAGPALPYPGTSSNALYNPLAGMFASPQQPAHYPHHQQPPQQHLHQQPPQAGLGAGGMSPGLALLRQLQGASAAQQHHQAAQQQALHHQQQPQMQLGGGYVDPAIMAARPAAPPGFGSQIGVTAGLGYDRPRPAMPPPGFGLQF